MSSEENKKRLTELENLVIELRKLIDNVKTKEEVFLEMINGCSIDTETFKKERPNSKFFIKDKKCFLELKKSDLLCDYDNIWSVFESQFDMNYNQIQGFIKDMVEEHLNMKGVTAVKITNWTPAKVEEHLNMKGVTANINTRETSRWWKNILI